MHCDHTVHFSAEFSLQLESNVLGTLAPKHVHLLPIVFSISIWNTGEVGLWMCKLRLEANTNIDK